MKALSKAIASGIIGLLAIGAISHEAEAFSHRSKLQPLQTTIKYLGSTIAVQNSLEDLPNGTYAYKENKPPRRIDNSKYFVFRKIGTTVVGNAFQPFTDWTYCFKGQLQGQLLIDMTVAETIMGRGSSKYSFSKARPASLMNYQPISLRQVFSMFPKTLPYFKECLILFKNP